MWYSSSNLIGLKVRHSIYSVLYSLSSDATSICKKDDFYRLLRKACQKKEKRQKLIVAGDFNAKTDLALKKCCYVGQIIVQDENCNTNGTRMKDFCRHNKLCITSTFFNYPLENRYTWYSIDGKTKRVNDYVLMERQPQIQHTMYSLKDEPKDSWRPWSEMDWLCRWSRSLLWKYQRYEKSHTDPMRNILLLWPWN